ncbi:MAG: sugar ABC transporter permease [Firmicutes bacterium]|nr:sugar ABC transporter permease [Bacillota bacterium]
MPQNRKMAGRGFIKTLTSDPVFGYLLVLPILLWVIATVGYPLISAIYTSFTNLGFLGASADFIGIRNYARVFQDTRFWSAFSRSIVWTLSNALLQTILGFMTALILNQRFKGQGFARMWIILSWIVPTVVVAIIWRWVLSGTFGVLNYILENFGLVSDPINFLGSIKYAMVTLIGINSWRWFPFLSIIILATLQTIPEDQYEAADIDGAGALQKFLYITFPFLKPTLTVLGLIGTLWSINVFDIIWMLTQGGPSGVTTTLPVYIYEKGFKAFAMGEAATASAIMFIFLVVFSLLYVRINKMGKEEAAWW